MMTAGSPPNPDLLRWVKTHKYKELSWRRLAGDGSDKIFWQIMGSSPPIIAVDGSRLTEDRWAENRAFLRIGQHLFRAGLPVPEIYHQDVDKGFFLIEDLGDGLLAEAVHGRSAEEIVGIYVRVADALLELQSRGIEDFDAAWCAQTREYDQAMIRTHESGYFLRAFITGWCRLEPSDQVRRELADLAETAAGIGPKLFMHRDFQSRNVILQDGRVRIIDYQGGRIGPPGYDLASLLSDPYVDLSTNVQDEIMDHYTAHGVRLGLFGEDAFRSGYPFLKLHRYLQMLGAFAFLTQAKGRPGFARYIPTALGGLKAILSTPAFDRFTALRELVAEAAVRGGPHDH